MTLYALNDATPELPEVGRYWIAPSADVMGRVRLEEDASIWFGAVLRGDNDLITIGKRTNIQDGCVLHTDEGLRLDIGEDCTIGHKAILHGCQIGAGTLIGMGAIILNRTVIGKGCLIGAQSLIPEGKTIPDYSLVMGAPGKVVRVLDEDARARLLLSADHYVQRWKLFSTGLKAL